MGNQSFVRDEMTTTVSIIRFLLFALSSAATTTDNVQESSILEDPIGPERHLDAAAYGLTALTGDAEVANSGTCTITNRLEKGFARKGEAFREAYTPDATRCATVCADTVEGCVAINYRERDKTCFFLADPGYIYTSAGYTTALVNPSKKDICNSGNTIIGWDNHGQNMDGSPHNVPSATDCCRLCYSTKGCIAYVLHSGFNRCYLKSSISYFWEVSHCMTGLACLAVNA